VAETLSERIPTMSNIPEVELTVTCKPYTAFGRGKYRVLVELGEHPRVRVWDHIGHIFTVCHSLTPASERSIIARARKIGGAS
jgi:hypothetical protein